MISFSREAFARNLKSYRTREEFTQEELSLECGYDRTYVGKIERGSKDPSMEAIIRIAEVLDVPASALFENELNRKQNASDEFYVEAFKNAIHFILITDPSGKILQANEAVETFSGHERSDLLGNSILKASLWENYESDSIWIKQGLEQASWGNSFWNELTVTDNDGDEFDVAVAISPVQLSELSESDIDLVIVEGYLRK